MNPLSAVKSLKMMEPPMLALSAVEVDAAKSINGCCLLAL